MPELATKIRNLPWIEDGIGRTEFSAVRGLILLVNLGHLASLIEQQWVVEGSNYPALESLWFLAINNPKDLTRVMSHPTVSDGISDQEAKIVATLHFVLHPDELDKLLDPERVTLEERTITLPLAGETDINIIRTRPGTDYTMDLLEHAVRSIEEFMGLPFPRRQVIYLFEEGSNLGKPAARNANTHVSILVDEQTLDEESLLALITHEASHYYWGGPTRWVSEGAAIFLETMAMNMPHGPLQNPPCVLARNILELERLDRKPSTSGEALSCHYSLGERLFRDLYRNMHDTTFRLAFRRLYLHTVIDEVGDNCGNAATSICHVKAAYTAEVPEETVPTVERVITRWYDGTEPYDMSWMDDTPVDAGVSAIDGRIEGAYLSLSRGGISVSTVTVGPNRNPVIHLNLDYSYRNSSGLDSLPIEIAHYFEDGFEFLRRRMGLPLPAAGARRTHHIWIPHEKNTGRYWVHVYWGEQKIAEATFETVPEPDPHSIRGVVTVPDGPSPERIALWVKRGEEEFWGETGPDGTFDIVVSSGSYTLEVHVLADSVFHFVGWYDGRGAITADPSQASRVIVDGENVVGIEIRLPTDTEGLLCPPGSQRSPRTGSCTSQ